MIEVRRLLLFSAALILSLVPATPQCVQIPPPPPEEQGPVQEPPEEDATLTEKPNYVLNPLQAEKELKVGNYYFKKGSYNAAARRFEEATKWDPNSAEAFYRLGEAQTKLKDEKAARETWKQFLELEPDSKRAAAIRKKLKLR